MNKSNIVFIGFMGTGKSTIGTMLAERLGWSFIDSDKVIEANQQMTIPDLFRLHGETDFRRMERDAIRAVMSNSKQVVATGGGAVLLEENREAMQKNGFVIALKASPEAVIERVSGDRNRPLLDGNLIERVHTLLQQRAHAYDFADLAIQTDHMTPEEVISVILKASGSFISPV